jgi:hypothetical protein
MIMTPAGGLALGEAFQQLSSFFDRGGADPVSQAMAFLFNPAKKLHDWVDGVTVDHDPRARGWHEFTLLGGAGALSQSASRASYFAVRVAAETRLFRAPGYGEAGRSSFSWADGNASRIGLGVTFTGSSVVDFLFDTETALVGIYVRDIAVDGASRRGWDLFLGGTAGYEYGLHRWDLASDVPNSIALVRLPGASVRARWFAGRVTVSAGMDAALTFGGVQPFAFQQAPVYLPERTALPNVLTANGYYFALGFRGAPSAEVSWKELSAGGSLQVDLLSGITQPNLVPPPGTMIQLEDQRWLVEAWARWRPAGRPVEVSLTGQWRSRSGSADALSACEQERSLLGNLAVVF